MGRSAIFIALSVFLSCRLISFALPALARGGATPQQEQARQAQAAQQAQSRSAQEQQSRALEEHAREGQQRAQQDAARRFQEQGQRAQQESARRSQEQAQRQQQQQAQRQQQEQAQRQQQERQQEQAQGQQQELERRQQQEQEKQARRLQQGQEESAKRQQREEEQASKLEPRQQQERGFASEESQRAQRDNEVATQQGRSLASARAVSPKPLPMNSAALHRAISMPVLENNATPEEREHAQVVVNNLQQHLLAVPAAQAPQNFSQLGSASVNRYFGNYPITINNQPIIINRENTFFNPLPYSQFPFWYQPQPGWTFASGFVLGSAIQCGLDWLRFGWHPYYGPEPQGFICAQDYIPTPWIYFPAYGLWRQAGCMTWAEGPPEYEYSAPISVEVLEPRVVRARDPFTGWMTNRTINAVYLYNAFYDPEMERYGYVNQHGYFIWLNL